MNRMLYFALFLPLLLAGCGTSQQGMQDLEAWIETVRATSTGKEPDPLPGLKEYQPYSYAAEGLKDPFTVPQLFQQAEERDVAELAPPPIDNGIRPDPDRPREELEKYALGSLVMVGTMSPLGEESRSNVFALVRDPEGIVHRISEGNHMGSNHGRVIGISSERINLIEIVPDQASGGWKEQDAELALPE